MKRPDYHGGSIVNLMSSILQACGGYSPYPPLRLLHPGDLLPATNIVLLVVDGLGADYLQRTAPGGPLAKHLVGAMTSVFPPTTAAAITTILTGDAPQQHAIPGWFTYFRELGCVMTVLPGHPRYGGIGYRRAKVDATKLFDHTPIFDRIETQAVVVSPTRIAESDFNRAHLGRATLRTFTSFPQMFQQALAAIRADRARKLLYLYWPQLDSIGHDKGIESKAARSHLGKIERALTEFLEAARDTDTVLLVTADHGQIDTGPSDCIDLADHPALAQTLTLPLCGEPRAAFCYVRPEGVAAFEQYCREVLPDRIDLWRSRDLVADGLFGLGEPNPRLLERVGDYCMLMRERCVMRDRLPSEKPHAQVGVHGGLSAPELEVPLCVFRL
jgi:hypothetical protein